MPVKHEDIARAAGVDRTTVSRALAGRGRMSDATRELIRTIAKEMGYRPHKMASSLATGRSELIGLLIESGASNWLDILFGNIQDEMRDTSYSTIARTHAGRADLERDCLESFIERRVDGVIAMPSSHTTDPAPYRDFLDSGGKLVLIDRIIEGLLAPHVIADNYSAGRLSTEHLTQLGHKRIAYLVPPIQSPVIRERVRGYRDALAAAGIKYDESLVVPVEFTPESGAERTSYLLSLPDPPTAVVVRHDIVGFGVEKAIFDAGLSVPEDMSIVGYEDMWANSIVRVPLTTVRHPSIQIGRIAAGLLSDELSGKHVGAAPVVIGVELVVRDSCAAPKTIR